MVRRLLIVASAIACALAASVLGGSLGAKPGTTATGPANLDYIEIG